MLKIWTVYVCLEVLIHHKNFHSKSNRVATSCNTLSYSGLSLWKRQRFRILVIPGKFGVIQPNSIALSKTYIWPTVLLSFVLWMSQTLIICSTFSLFFFSWHFANVFVPDPLGKLIAKVNRSVAVFNLLLFFCIHSSRFRWAKSKRQYLFFNQLLMVLGVLIQLSLKFLAALEKLNNLINLHTFAILNSSFLRGRFSEKKYRLLQ